MIKRATDVQTAGENALFSSLNKQNPYLNQMAYDLQTNTNDILNAGRNQVQAGLAQQGIRGGQAGTLLARSVGNMSNQANQDLNNMMYNDIQQRKALAEAYNQAKALAGLNATLQ